MRTIYTIDSRDCVFLKTVKERFGFGDEDMHTMISELHDALRIQLHDKGVGYDALKRALIPSKARKELVLVCDSSAISDPFYGGAVFDVLLGAFDKESVNSVMMGDYLDIVNDAGSQRWLYEILAEHVDIGHERYGDGSMLFLVYIQNANATLERNLKRALEGRNWFVGMADVTFGSRFKGYLPSILGAGFIKYRDIVIQPTADYRRDRDENMFLFDFEGAGFVIRNVAAELFDVFLRYKIERPYLAGEDFSDRSFSLNAMTPVFRDLDDCTIEVPEAKMEYLRANKGGTLRNCGLEEMSAEELGDMIRDRIDSNYIYSLQFGNEWGVLQFDIMLEFRNGERRGKAVLGLKYDNATHTVRPVTMF